jgi:hypothetical protein
MTPWDVVVLAKSKKGAEDQLKHELSKRTEKHVEVMTPIRVWLALMPELPGHVFRAECRGWINGKGAKISAIVELQRLHE